MPTYNYILAGGADPVAGWGDRWKIGFGGTFAAAGEQWTMQITSDEGDFTLGSGALFAQGSSLGGSPVCLTYRNRVYLSLGSQFNFSDNDDPTAWEEQAPGAGFVPYVSQYGNQDSVEAFSVLQGRLCVFGRRSIQIWTIDADPSNFALVQALDNIGTIFPLSTQQLGDFDVLFLDDTGIRSLRSREVTLNAYVDDVGSQIDDFVRDALLTNAGPVCGIVEPTTKNFWLSLNGVIYVLSRHQSSKVSAWGTYLPVGSDGVNFTPQKFEILNGRVYCRAVEGGLYLYGGANNTTYDNSTIVTVQVPWLDDKRPDHRKQFTAINAVIAGKWTVSLSADPQSNVFTTCIPTRGSATVPNTLTDSTYDLRNFSVPGLIGTHFSIKCVSVPGAATDPAVLSSLTLHYNNAGVA
jgi:hypothetical protein